MTPPGLAHVQLFSGGTEAVESAIRLARAHTGKYEVLSFWGGFHGKTAGTLAQMGSEFKHGLGPLASAAVASSVGVIQSEGLVERSRRVGARLKAGLERLAEHHASVVNVRGEGLFLGFDLVDPASGEPWSTAACRALFDATLRRGMISMTYAPRVRVNPPLVLREEEADEAIAILDAALGEVRAG